MNTDTLYIEEEATNLFWGPVILVTGAAATYLLSDAFISSAHWTLLGFRQLLALLFLLISFYGIIKISAPRYHLIFVIKEQTVIIDVYRGEDQVQTIRIPLDQMEALKFSPHAPRSNSEALFDLTPSYHPVYKPPGQEAWQRLIDLGSESITLKVQDIGKIIHFIMNYKPDLQVPGEQAPYL